MKRTSLFSKPPGPFFGLWSWQYVDLIKTYKLVSSEMVKNAYQEFPHKFPPGSDFPEIELETTDGQVINTANFKGKKHFVLFTGAIT